MKRKTQILKVIVLAASMLFAIESHAYVSGNYPRLATMRIEESQQLIASSNNMISYAIENGQSVSLEYNQIKSMTPYIFRKEYFDSYVGKKLNSPTFVKGLQAIVNEFACAEYRFRHRMPQSDSCSGYVSDQNDKEKMPFVDGQFKSFRLEQHINSKRDGISYQFYLPSTSEKALDSIWGAVHELGTFFGRAFDPRQLVLSVYMQAYPLNENGFRDGNPFYDKPIVFFIVLPPAVEIFRQDNQIEGGQFAQDKAQLLILGMQ
ncbi:TPA: hypothetical protein ACGUU3_003388 [Vibrio vulnificus]|uniref:hypothetical protein n=1 Tax=Vibrio vulnificus TaxID=672 RepID=UPI001302D6F9|nr:hypothetical protein [Vibrio vulnificus]